MRDVPVPWQVFDELVAAARAEHAVLAVLPPERRDVVLDLVRAGEAHRQDDPRYRAELARWTRELPGRRDGVPAAAFGPRPTPRSVPIRDFGLVQPAQRRQVRPFEHEPTVAILHTAGDGPRDWLRAGQALERVLLTATVRGLVSTLLAQPLEIPRLRGLLSDDDGRTAQAIIRSGYGSAGAPAPRRPLADVLAGPAGPFERSPNRARSGR